MSKYDDEWLPPESPTVDELISWRRRAGRRQVPTNGLWRGIVSEGIRARARKVDMGYVYFFVCAGPGSPTKIGFSHDPARRLPEVQAYCPYTIHLFGAIVGLPEHEQRLHRRLEATRMHGEWFAMSPQLEAILAEVPPYDPRAPRVLRPDIEYIGLTREGIQA